MTTGVIHEYSTLHYSSVTRGIRIHRGPGPCSRRQLGGGDKARHLVVSAALGTASGAYFENKWTAFGVAMIPGLAKEIMDSRKHDNHFSGKDLVANAIGAALGVQLGHWMITSRGLTFQSSF